MTSGGAQQTFSEPRPRFPNLVDEQVLWFEVAMENAVLVAKGQAFEELIHERLEGEGQGQ